MLRSHFIRGRAALLAALLACLCAGSLAQADTHHWNGEGDGVSWSDPDNWLEDAVPTLTSDGEGADDAVVDGAYTVIIDVAIHSIHALTIDGDALVVVPSGSTLYTQNLTIIDGGLELEEFAGVGANISWAKANRGILQVEADGYICGKGVIVTRASSVVKLMSTRSADFDMTAITLRVDYGENLWVCSNDIGRDDLAYWEGNFAIGKLVFDDYRYTSALFEADGSTGGDVNALYCYELEFAGGVSSGAALNLQGTKVYVRDRITWFDDTVRDTDGQLTVATAYDSLDPTSSLFDDDLPQATAWVGTATNTAPIVDAGSDATIMMPAYALLDATVTDDGLPFGALGYAWTMVSGPGAATFADPAACDTRVSFSIDGVYVLQLTASDTELAASDTVTITVNPHVQDTHHWTGYGDGVSWNDPDNWLELAVPTTVSNGEGADNVEIDGSYLVRVTESVLSVHNVLVDGDAMLVVDPGVTLRLQSLNLIDGGLILDYDAYDDSSVIWAKANRGILNVEADGYIAGCGLIQTYCNWQGVRLKSTRAEDFDMTAITLRVAYAEPLWTCSADLGADSADYWDASNYAIGALYFSDRRYAHTLCQADGSAGDGTNAVYCYSLRFGGDADESASANLNSVNLYVLDRVTWGNNAYVETPGALTVHAALALPDFTTAIWDDNATPGIAYLGVDTSNGIPVDLLELTNRLSGISVGLSGVNGSDWAVEHSYHDTSVSDQTIYLKSDVDISLAHNANNTLMKRDSIAWANWTVDGPDGIADSGDEGDIHWKIDRDMQSHRYNGTTLIPSFAPLYSGSFNFNTLTYDGSLPVLGATGDNGGPYGTSPRGTTTRFGYGQLDAFGNEWHTLTYWDDDEPVYASIPETSHRQGASDGHWVYVCVNPVTPVLQLHAPEGEQFYTTPLKTYHIPKTWEQTSYLTDGVVLSFVNLTDANPVYYRIDGGAWVEARRGVAAETLFAQDNVAYTLEYRCGAAGAIASRTCVLNPATPGAGEVHGSMMWASAAEKAQCVAKLQSVQPFAYSYDVLCDSYYQNLTTVYTDARSGWRSGAGMASTAMNNAFPVAIDGLVSRLDNARMAKLRLLRMARLEAVGFEYGVDTTPSKDYLNELGQTIQQFADAGVAYDYLAGSFRVGDHAEGMTPIEELKIRDGLGEIAKTILQVRDNWSYVSGSGNTHWAHGYELAIGTIALAMPTYATPYFGVSGGDLTSVNTFVDANGYYYNPFPTAGLTWYECVADPEVPCTAYPDNKAPMRSEFQITDEGYWSGPNYLVGDGDRYVTGAINRRLVDLMSGGLANAENRIELIEMGGYESPFVGRIQSLTLMRKIAGDAAQQPCVTTYNRRRLLAGYVPLSWDAVNLKYVVGEARVNSSLISFNNNFDWAGYPSAVSNVSDYLTYVNRYYGFETGSYPSHIVDSRKSLFSSYVLACCADPSDINTPVGDANHAPTIKPMFKYVVQPGETIEKVVLAMDLDDDAITLSVSNLPVGATWNAATRTIVWTPGAGDLGVHVVSVMASDAVSSTTREFPMIVMTDPNVGPVPAAPQSVSVTLTGDDATMNWSAPAGVSVANYLVYLDGNLFDVLDSAQTSITVYDLPPGSHTRLFVSLLETDGDESSGVQAVGSYVSVPK